MPFVDTFNDVYETIKVAVCSAVSGISVECIRLDDKPIAGRITERLVQELTESTICIADVTDQNPNVMWEVGFAMAQNKPVLLLSQGAPPLPFDLKDMQTLFYDRTALSKTLRTPLAQAFRHTLAAYQSRTVARSTSISSPNRAQGLTIAITGSMRASAGSTQVRVESVLTPYLGDDTTWLIGSWGIVDEIAIEFLARQRQRVTVVGYSELDISPTMLKLIEHHKISFVAGNLEQVPKGLSGPSGRDAYMISRSDLMILFWDGTSTGTKKLMQWYREQGRDHVVAFV